MKILNNAKTLSFITLFLFFTLNTAQATIVDNGMYTSDTVAGLDWLDVTKTQGRSYNDISSQLGIGGEFEGWRYASSEDFRTLILNHTGATTFEKIIKFDTAILDSLAQSLGITKIGIDPKTEWVHGLTADIGVFGTEHTMQFIFTEPSFPRGSAILNWMQQEDSESSSNVGSHLIRGAVSPVPVPAAIWLMATGILGLFGLSRKKKQ